MKEQKIDLESLVMKKITANEIKMKPKWLLAAGSILTAAGLVGLTFGTIFLTNLTIFLVKKRGPGYGKLEVMLDSFPLWIPALAIIGIVLGIWLLKKYDFSYKKNFLLIIFLFVVSILVGGLLVDRLGLNEVWSRRGVTRNFYRQFENRDNPFIDRPKGVMKNRGAQNIPNINL